MKDFGRLTYVHIRSSWRCHNSSKSHLLLLLKTLPSELFKDACSDSDKLTPNLKLSGWAVDSLLVYALTKHGISYITQSRVKCHPLSFLFNYPQE